MVRRRNRSLGQRQIRGLEPENTYSVAKTVALLFGEHDHGYFCIYYSSYCITKTLFFVN
jgi:hypothetical protein